MQSTQPPASKELPSKTTPPFSEQDLEKRLESLLSSTDGLSINMDAKRRLSLNSPKSDAWTVRETLQNLYDLIKSS